MLIESVLLVLLGAGVAALGTILGAGGGFVLVPVLLLLFPDRDAAKVTSMSLLVVFATGVSGSTAYARQRRIDYLSGAVFALCTIPGSIGGALLVTQVSRRVFEFGFAFVLGLLGLFLFTRRDRAVIRAPLTGRGMVVRDVQDGDGNRFFYSYRLWHGAVASAAIAFFAALGGIGGGVVQVPVMVTALHFPVHIAVATSQFVLVLASGEALLTHAATGSLAFDRPLAEAALIALGAIPGAQAGAFLARRLRGSAIIRILSLTLLAISLRLAWSAVAG